MIEIAVWIVGTFLLVSLCAAVAKHAGPEYIVGLFASLYVMSNVLANKTVQVGPYSVTAGIITYSIAFYLTDMLSELYGKEEARKAVWLGFLAQIILVYSVWVAINWPAAPFWDGQQAFVETLGYTWRIALASLVTYVISQNHDVWAYHFWRELTDGKYLWLRNNASTIVTQAIDSTLFITLAFYGTMPLAGLWNMILGTFVVKLGIAVLDTPFLYTARWYFRK